MYRNWFPKGSLRRGPAIALAWAALPALGLATSLLGPTAMCRSAPGFWPWALDVRSALGAYCLAEWDRYLAFLTFFLIVFGSISFSTWLFFRYLPRYDGVESERSGIWAIALFFAGLLTPALVLYLLARRQPF